MRKKLMLLPVIAAILAGPACAEEVKLRAISAWPTSFELTKAFNKYIDRVNADGKGVVQIELAGGPEIVPADQQDTALRNGLFDMQMGTPSYYGGVMPEGDALFASNLTADEARERGATTELLNGILRERVNAQFIAWQGGGIGFHIFLSEEPKITNGQVDLSGLKLRSSGAYKEWFEALNGTNVMMSMPDTFSAFERGMVQGVGFPAINFAETGVAKFIKYRIDPPVWRLDVLIIMNADKWDGLSDEAKAVLTKAAVEHEAETYKTFGDIAAAEAQLLKDAGAQFYTLEPEVAKNYVALAHDTIWKRLKDRAPEHYDALRKAFYKE